MVWNIGALWAYNILASKNSQMDWNMTRHYIWYWIQLFPTITKYPSWGSRDRPHSWACFNQQESVVTPTLHCKRLIRLWSLFEIFHIFCEGSAGRGIITKDKPNVDLLANFSRRPHPVPICPGAPAAEVELWNISQVELSWGITGPPQRVLTNAFTTVRQKPHHLNRL